MCAAQSHSPPAQNHLLAALLPEQLAALVPDLEPVALAREEPINPNVGVYLNRLADCLFVLARAANARASVADVPWNSPRRQQQ